MKEIIIINFIVRRYFEYNIGSQASNKLFVKELQVQHLTIQLIVMLITGTIRKILIIYSSKELNIISCGM